MKQTLKDIISKLRKYEVRIRKAVHSHMHGNYHSIFKGSGIEFSDLREYQYGDDIRTIDWNVTAKGHGSYVRLFQEDKEQHIIFLVDVSASLNIGKKNQTKLDIIKEISGVLMLSAVKEGSEIGLVCYSDKKELYVAPDKGIKHAYYLISKLFNLESESRLTDLNKAMQYTLSILKRKSIVIVLSDFIDDQYEKNLISLSKKHDLVLIQIQDSREMNLPSMGIIPLIDMETNRTIWTNSSSQTFRNTMEKRQRGIRERLELFSKANESNYKCIYTHEDYIVKLVELFRVRNFHKKSA
ncbi:MAG: DUF58 domain-containing protein [Cytophagales bacterium]|nr:DUF58 domain-containing protein [Cytophaga sp.]